MASLTFKQKLHSHGWLILVNALVAMLVAIRYFAFLPEFPTDILGASFIVTGTWGQMTLFAALIGLVTIPLLLLPTLYRRLSIAAIASFALIMLLIDTFVFAQYRFHINSVVVELVFSGDVVDFPLVTWLMAISGLVILFACQYLTICYFEGQPAILTKKIGKKFAWITFLFLLVNNGIHIWASANAYQPVLMVKRYLPLFQPATANSLMLKYGWLDEEAMQRQKTMKMDTKSDLNYPLNPLQTTTVAKPVNIVMIVIDSWRADTFNADNSPNMWDFAQSGEMFHNHISTGNATRTGIFGLFYGMPGTYWHGFLANRHSPVLMDRLQQMDYQIGLFAAASLNSPEFDRTAFVNIKNLRLRSEGNSPSARDADLTADWLNWYGQRDQSKPTFSFLFYDSPHGYDFPKDYPHQYKPMLETVNYLELNNDTDTTPFMNRYKTSVHYVDSKVKEVLDTLKESGELDNTVVIITGDHAQELNDNKLNFWGHNGNFSPAQTHVPFAIIGPKVTQSVDGWNESFTSHEDVVPTLMKNYLGVTNDIKDYSTGEDLLNKPTQRDWVLSSSYSGYGIVTKDSILEVNAGGQSELVDKRNHPMKDSPNYQYVQEALNDISHFSK